MRYMRELDGLRALAIAPVVLYHAGFRLFGGGFVGVDVFFVISGYLITLRIIEEKQKGTFTLTGFYERRARRILPALLVMLLVTVLLAWFALLPADMQFFSASLVAVLGFCSNVVFYHATGYFGVESSQNLLIHTWSLAVEEQYYILFPLLLMLAWRLGLRAIYVACGAIAACSLLAAQHLAVTRPAFAFYLLPTRGWEIITGCLVAFYMNHPHARTLPLGARQAGSLIGVCLILCSVFTFGERTQSPNIYALVPVMGTALVILFAGENTLVGRALGLPPLVGIGLISYSLYLFHQPLFAFERQRELSEPTGVTLSVLTLAAVGLAYLNWRFVEQPCRRASSLSRRALLGVLATASVCLLGVAAGGLLTNGFPQRFGETQQIYARLFKDLEAERFSVIGSDVCHFNNITEIGIDRFLQQWNCRDDGAHPELHRIPVIVTGDSVSADKAVALKANGLLPLQLTGGGCSIVPDKMSARCRKMYARLHAQVADDPYYKYLVLAHVPTEDELTPDAIQEAVAFWKKFNKELIWFTAMPTFPRLEEHLEEGRQVEIDFRMADLSERDELVRLLSTAGVHVIQSRRLFCGIGACGYVSGEGCVLLADYLHLSVWGAKLFGRALLQTDPLFGQWAGSAATSPYFEDSARCHKAIN